jgi:MFS family permease
VTESLRLRLFAPACAFAAAWNGANVGPFVRPLQEDFGISLGVLGLLSGTMLFAASIVGLLIAPRIARRLGVARSMQAACCTLLLGNVLFAASPSFVTIAVARVVIGVAFGLAIVLAPVFARAAAGVGLVGAVGAAIQGGIAAGLLVGGLVIDAGLSCDLGS